MRLTFLYWMLIMLLESCFCSHLLNSKRLTERMKNDLVNDLHIYRVKKSLRDIGVKLSRNGGKTLRNKDYIHHVLVMNLAVSINDFLLKETQFLQAIENHIQNNIVKCEVAEITLATTDNVAVEWFCYYRNPPSHTKWPHTMFVPVRQLERLMTSGGMRGFLQKYNVTQFYDKESLLSETSELMSITTESWFLITVTAVTSILVVVILILLVICCQNSKKKKETLETFPQTRFSPPLKTGSKNSFATSPRKSVFSYSPSKVSTPIFSFSSPLKTRDKVVLPTQSPIEMIGPFAVQPQMDLLYPKTSGPPRKWSENSLPGNNNSRNRSLYQSRRGSSASIVIELSPKSIDLDEFSSPHESPTEEILLRKSRIMKFQELHHLKDNDKFLSEEFWNIPPNTVSRKDLPMKHTAKNRYPDILPNSRSMVHLQAPDNSPIYINANFIKGYNGEPNQFIATQGPLVRTMPDFWLMMWHLDCSIIVMLTKLTERNKDKCTQYWPCPDTMTQQIYGDIIVTYDSEMVRDGYKMITMYAAHKGSDESRKITHFWFTAWPDHKLPKKCQQVVSLASEVRHLQSQHVAPLVVHCSAGRGRTGCFIALILGMTQIDDAKEVDVLKIVSQMRVARGGMIEKELQYGFLYQALYKYWSQKRRNSSLSSPSFCTNTRYNFQQDSTGREERDSDDSLEESHSSFSKFRGFSFVD